MTPLLSICMVTFNALEETLVCLRSLYAHPPESEWEVLLADNGSSDGTVPAVRREFPEVKLLRGDRNEGFAVPVNRCLRAAQGEFLALLNNDTIVLPGLWGQLLEAFKRNPRAGIVGPKVLHQDGTMQRQCRRSFAPPEDLLWYLTGLTDRFPKHPRFARYVLGNLPDDDAARVEAVSGSCMLIRRTLMDQIGLLDEKFFAYQEDSDYCQRAARADWEVWYWPTAQVVHLGGRGGSHVERRRSVVEWHRSYIRYYRKYFAEKHSPLVNGFLYLLMEIKLGVALIPFVFKRK
jgi:GT2 family glycosyltransferase